MLELESDTHNKLCALSPGVLGQLDYFHFLDFYLSSVCVQLDQTENFNFLDFYLFEIQVVLPGPPVQCNKWSCEPISGQCSHCQACLLSSLPALPHHTTQCTTQCQCTSHHKVYHTPHTLSWHQAACLLHHTPIHSSINFCGLCGFQCDDVWYEVCFVRCNRLNKHRLQIGLHRAHCTVSRVLLY